MNRHVFTSRSRRTPAGPTIELLDSDDAPPAPSRESRHAPRQRRVVPVSPAAAPAQGSGWLRPTALVVAAIGVTTAGFLYVSGQAAASEPVAAAIVTVAEPPVEIEPVAPVTLPAPTDIELAALESGGDAAMGTALRALRQREVTAAGLRAVDTASRRTADVELQRHVICYRVRGGAPLGPAFDALPATSADAEWSEAGAACLVEAIAARASEAPGRALPILVERGLALDADPILAGLAQLDLPVLPVAVVDALDHAVPTRTRRAAVRIAIACGAATKWPERVATWLTDPNRTVRLHAHAELLRQGDEASRLLAARAIAADPADDELRRRGVEELGREDGFDRLLATVAADASLPAAARAHAADLVGQHGGPAACRLVAAIATGEPALASGLFETRMRIDQRFGSSFLRQVRR